MESNVTIEAISITIIRAFFPLLFAGPNIVEWTKGTKDRSSFPLLVACRFWVVHNVYLRVSGSFLFHFGFKSLSKVVCLSTTTAKNDVGEVFSLIFFIFHWQRIPCSSYDVVCSVEKDFPDLSEILTKINVLAVWHLVGFWFIIFSRISRHEKMISFYVVKIKRNVYFIPVWEIIYLFQGLEKLVVYVLTAKPCWNLGSPNFLTLWN